MTQLTSHTFKDTNHFVKGLNLFIKYNSKLTLRSITCGNGRVITPRGTKALSSSLNSEPFWTLDIAPCIYCTLYSMYSISWFRGGGGVEIFLYIWLCLFYFIISWTHLNSMIFLKTKNESKCPLIYKITPLSSVHSKKRLVNLVRGSKFLVDLSILLVYVGLGQFV